MAWDQHDPNRLLGDPVRLELVARHRKTVRINEEIEGSLQWRPTLHFEANEFSIIAADVRISPFPESLMLTRAKIAQAHLPITLYSVCELAAFVTREGQKEAKEAKAHGLGLFTVDPDGVVAKQFSGIPIINHIHAAEIDALLVGIPKATCLRIKDAFDSYNSKPTDGITAISEVLEDLVNNAAKGAVKKGWLTPAEAGLMLAGLLDGMALKPQFLAQSAAIGSVRGFVKEYRNTANHSPRSRRQAYNKYVKCRQGFYAGITAIDNFHKAMKGAGLNPKVS
ncbi:MAG: hypothetical protein ACKVOE_07795 [Rickettsiales bacterium]